MRFKGSQDPVRPCSKARLTRYDVRGQTATAFATSPAQEDQGARNYPRTQLIGIFKWVGEI